MFIRLYRKGEFLMKEAKEGHTEQTQVGDGVRPEQEKVNP